MSQNEQIPGWMMDFCTIPIGDYNEELNACLRHKVLKQFYHYKSAVASFNALKRLNPYSESYYGKLLIKTEEEIKEYERNNFHIGDLPEEELKKFRAEQLDKS